MIKEICKDEEFLAIPSELATAADAEVAQDLLDTLDSLKEECVGLAANMIGVGKQVIVFDNNGKPAVMFNPKIKWASSPYKAEEGCMSLEGERTTQRYRRIKVAFEELVDGELVAREKAYRDWTAEIIQHQIDHCKGILI